MLGQTVQKEGKKERAFLTLKITLRYL